MPHQRIERPMGAERLAGLYRDVDCVAQEAVNLVAQGLAPSPRMHDDATTALTHYWRAHDISETVQDLSRLARRMPIPHGAVQFHEQAPEGVRTMAQALILADQSSERIGPAVGQRADVIDFYERCFYDVRDRLGLSAFIIDSVIFLPASGASGEGFAAATVKLLAWLTGPAAVDVLLPSREPHGTSIADLAVKLARRARILIDVQTLCHDWLADPQRQQQMREVLEAIEASPGPYGDEQVPRSESQLLAARRTDLKQLLFDRLCGTASPNGKSDHVS